MEAIRRIELHEPSRHRIHRPIRRLHMDKNLSATARIDLAHRVGEAPVPTVASPSPASSTSRPSVERKKPRHQMQLARNLVCDRFPLRLDAQHELCEAIERRVPSAVVSIALALRSKRSLMKVHDRLSSSLFEPNGDDVFLRSIARPTSPGFIPAEREGVNQQALADRTSGSPRRVQRLQMPAPQPLSHRRRQVPRRAGLAGSRKLRGR